jgi:conjugative transfer region protein TrbK
MDGKMFARVGAVVFVAIAITATAIEMTRKEEAPEVWPSGRAVEAQADPLRDALIRCQALGEDGPRDPECRRAWTENRERFLSPGARPLQRMPEAPDSPRGVPAPLSDPLHQTPPTPAAPRAVPQHDEAN